MAGRFEEAREHLDRSSVFLDELNLASSSWTYRSGSAMTRLLFGDREGAQRDLEARWQFFRGLGDYTPNAIGMQSACLLALLYCDDGRWDDAARCLAYGAEVPEPGYFLVETVFRLAGRARVAAHRGAHADAVKLAQRAVELAERSDMLNRRAETWLALAEVRAPEGRWPGRTPQRPWRSGSTRRKGTSPRQLRCGRRRGSAWDRAPSPSHKLRAESSRGP
jgi:hypothetical protein